MNDGLVLCITECHDKISLKKLVTDDLFFQSIKVIGASHHLVERSGSISHRLYGSLAALVIGIVELKDVGLVVNLILVPVI